MQESILLITHTKIDKALVKDELDTIFLTPLSHLVNALYRYKVARWIIRVARA